MEKKLERKRKLNCQRQPKKIWKKFPKTYRRIPEWETIILRRIESTAQAP
jgi:hypothetical protein